MSKVLSRGSVPAARRPDRRFAEPSYPRHATGDPQRSGESFASAPLVGIYTDSRSLFLNLVGEKPALLASPFSAPHPSHSPSPLTGAF